MVKTSLACRTFLCLAILALGTIGPVDADDAWRRTAQGWERNTTWETTRPTIRPSQRPAMAARTPVHPGQLAILQVAASCLVLAAFSSRLPSNRRLAPSVVIDQGTRDVP